MNKKVINSDNKILIQFEKIVKEKVTPYLYTISNTQLNILLYLIFKCVSRISDILYEYNWRLQLNKIQYYYFHQMQILFY